MTDKITISLKAASNEPVSLRGMTPEALDSFLIVISSLKAIATNVILDTDLSFIIQEGSAECMLDAPSRELEAIYVEMDTAIRGESEDKEIASNLRLIQEQLKRQGFSYQFNYQKNQEEPIPIHRLLINANQIRVKYRKKGHVFKVKILSGFLNLIGGKNPNYHFDYGDGLMITIVCTQDQAMFVNKFLYKTVNALVVCKEWTSENEKDQYYHRAIIEEDIVKLIKPFLKSYYRNENLLGRLDKMYNFVDTTFTNTNRGHEVLKYLLIAFNDSNFHLSELKTLLVISKPFKEHEFIKVERKSLLETYSKKRKNG